MLSPGRHAGPTHPWTGPDAQMRPPGPTCALQGGRHHHATSPASQFPALFPRAAGRLRKGLAKFARMGSPPSCARAASRFGSPPVSLGFACPEVGAHAGHYGSQGSRGSREASTLDCQDPRVWAEAQTGAASTFRRAGWVAPGLRRWKATFGQSPALGTRQMWLRIGPCWHQSGGSQQRFHSDHNNLELTYESIRLPSVLCHHHRSYQIVIIECPAK